MHGHGISDGGDDTRPVAHGEAQVILVGKVSTDRQHIGGNLRPRVISLASARNVQQIADNGNSRGVAACSVSAECGLSAVLAAR